MKKTLSIRGTFGIPKDSVIFCAVLYGVFFAIIIFCCGCSDNAIGTVVGESKTPSVPLASSNVSAKTESSSRITLSWSSVSEADGYNVYRSVNKDSDYRKIGKTTSTAYTDTKLLSGTDYHYKVFAYNSGGESSQASYTSATTIPDVPTIESVTPTSSGGVIVRWLSVFGATGYIVYRSASKDDDYKPILKTTSTTYTEVLPPGSVYCYRVSAYNGGGESQQSSSSCVGVPPPPPLSVSATATSSDSITVSWSLVPEATGYKVYQTKINADGRYDSVYTTTSTSYIAIGLSSGTAYYYKVSSYNNYGDSPLSSPPAPATTIPGAPDIKVESYPPNGLKVSWSSVYGATGYRVKRSRSAGGPYEPVKDTTSTSYIDIGLLSGTAYYYVVSSYNGSGESYPSSPDSGKTVLPPPDIPSGLKVEPYQPDGLKASWSYVYGATGYIVEHSRNANGPYEVVGNTTSTSYLDIGLLPATIYYYRVSAYNSSGGSQPSPVVSGLTIPATPSDLSATAMSSSSITLTWPSVYGATGYKVYYNKTGADDHYDSVYTTTSTSYIATGLSSGTTYYYAVSSYNISGESFQSSPDSATTFPGAPLNVSATATDYGEITLDWAPVNGAEGYNVYRCETANGIYEYVGSTSDPQYIDMWLWSGTTYYYKVSAYNSNDDEGPLSSPPVSARTYNEWLGRTRGR